MFAAILLVTTNLDGSPELTFHDLWTDLERWRLSCLDREWREGNLVGKGEPFFKHKTSPRDGIRSWKKWVSFL
jgi:hypothetical protein